MKKLKLTCAHSRVDNVTFLDFGNRVALELSIKSDEEEPVVMLNKSNVAKLIEFLNDLELAE